MPLKPLHAALLAAGFIGLPALALARGDGVGLGSLGNGHPASYSDAWGLNAAGQVAGESSHFDVNGNERGLFVFLWSNGVMRNLGGLGTDAGGTGSSAFRALNAAGQVVGYSDAYDAQGNSQGAKAFLWSNGVMRNLGSLGTDGSGQGYSDALAINAAGQVAGQSQYYINGADQGRRAFLWSNGTLLNLGSLGTDGAGYGFSGASDLNAAGQVAGYSQLYVNGADKGGRAFLWSNGVMRNLGSLGTDGAGNGDSYASALNAAGQVAGDSQYYGAGGASLGRRAFLWSNGVMSNLGSLGTDGSGQGDSRLTGLNAAGQVAGVARHFIDGIDQGQRAFLWSDGVMSNLGTLDGGESFATALNDSGQVVGQSGQGFATRAFLVNAGTMFDLNTLAPAGWTFTNANAINAWAQVAGSGHHAGIPEAFLVTLHPDWQGGNGSWADASRWNYHGMGAFGFSPGTPHDVLIKPAASATVLGPIDAAVRSLAVAAAGNNLVTLNLGGGTIATQLGTAIGANGSLAGNGRLVGNLTVQAGGRVRVAAGEALQLAGNVSLLSGGRIDAKAPGGRASLDIGGLLGNAAGARVNLLNADVVAHGGIVNRGVISIAGLTTLAGAVDNQAGGQLNVAGVGAQAIFWDNVRNDGSVTVTAQAAAAFFGAVTGAGSFLGGGTKEFAGGYSPGNSPALVTMAGPVAFAGQALTMELAGTAPGSGHDKIVFGGPVTLSGTRLVTLYLSGSGWAASAGQTYDLFDWDGGVAGSFASVSLPALAAGLAWDTSDLYVGGALSVTAVPEPERYALLLAGLGLIGVFTRRRTGR